MSAPGRPDGGGSAPDRDRLRAEVREAWSDPWRGCERLGLLEGSRRQSDGLSVCCPLHRPDAAPSCSVTRGPRGGLRVRCFAGCDFGGEQGGGDELSLVAAVRGLDVRRNFGEVLALAAELAGLGAPDAPGCSPRRDPPWRPAIVRAPPAAAPPVEDLGAFWESLPPLGAEAMAYLGSRGLGEAAAWCRGLADPRTTPRPDPPEGHLRDAEGRRSCGGPARCAACRWEWAAAGYAVALPLRDAGGRVVAVQVRNLHAEKRGERDHRFLAIGQTSVGVFGAPHAVAGAKNVIVAEGMTDSLAALLACRRARVSVVVGIAGIDAAAALDTLPLRGKRAIVASDPDAAGDLLYDGRSVAQAAAETERTGKVIRPVEGLAQRLRARGAQPVRARPPEGSDLAAMHAAGEDLVAFFRRALAEQAGFRAAPERLRGERAERIARAPRVLPFGVRFLDLALGGLAPRDLVLVGAASGYGKTEIGRIVAQTNAQAGRSVHYFALEAEPREIERRAKYAWIADHLLARVGGEHLYGALDHLEWSYGRSDSLTGPWEEEADRAVGAALRTLYTLYPDADAFGIDEFESAVRAVVGATDLVVLDHFHFLDFGEREENRAAKLAIRRIRHLALETGLPIIVIAHLRKTERGARRLIPVLDDIHGSSDVVKMATKVVFVAPARDRENSAPHLWKTYLSAGKCRVEGSRARYAACVVFDARRRAYEEDFLLGTVGLGGDKFAEVDPARWPAWARRVGSGDPRQTSWTETASTGVDPDDSAREPGSDG